jgi:hypothetical protein
MYLWRLILKIMTRTKNLIKLAKSAAKSADFTLSKPELDLLKAASNGKAIRYREDGKACEYPDNAASWEENHKISASLIVWLCKDSEACKFLTHSGLKIHGAMIEGALDLTDINLSIPLEFHHCVFTKSLRLERAKIKYLDLSGSYLGSDTIPYPPFDKPTMISLEARGIEVESDVLLRNGFKATERVSLYGAKIGGNLDCHEGVFHTSETDALYAVNAEIKGHVLLSDLFKAFGSVNFDRSTIGGYFSCTGGTFENPKGNALSVECAVIRGVVTLREGFTASGRVSFSGTTIGVDLDCRHGTFQNESPDAPALIAVDAEIKGSVLLDERFSSIGRVSLSRATIRGDLSCHGGTFNGHTKDALRAVGSRIEGTVYLNNLKATGQVSLSNATIGGDLRCTEARFDGLRENALTAEGSRIEGTVYFNNLKATGQVSLSNATIEGDLKCTKAKFDNLQVLDNFEKGALVAQNIKIAGNVFLTDAFEAKGCVHFFGAIIGGNFVCSGGVFENNEEIALNIRQAQVNGSILLDKDFRANGCVLLQGATIGDNLDCKKGNFFKNSEGKTLIAERATIKNDVYLSNEFKSTGCVSLSGASIGGHLICSGGKFSNHKGIALDFSMAEVRNSVGLNHLFEANGCVSLVGAFIGRNLTCEGGIFNNPKGDALDAQQVQVEGSVHLKNRFRALGKVDFANATIDGDFILQEICDSSRMKLDLRGARISTLGDTKDSWPKQDNLFLDGFVYEKIDANTSNRQTSLNGKSRLEWLRLQNPDNFSTQPYKQLANVLKGSGAQPDAVTVLMGMQDDLRRRGRLSHLGRVWNWMLGKTIGHGYRPIRAVVFSIVLIVFGGFWFHAGSQNLISPSHVRPTESSDLASVSKNYPTFNPWVYSLDAFIPVMNFHQQEYWLPNSNKGDKSLFDVTNGSWLQWYLWLHIALGWICTTLAVAGFTGLVRSVK